MSLVRINRFPASDLESPFRLFENFFPRLYGEDLPEVTRQWTPAVDIAENEEALVFTAELPGFNRDDLNIAVEDGRLTLSGERKMERKSDEYHRVERVYGRFERNFTLPTTVDPDKITANLKNGLLTIALPKREESKPRQIAVHVQ